MSKSLFRQRKALWRALHKSSSPEKEIKDIDAEIKLRRAEAKRMLNLESKVVAQREKKNLEK